MLALLLCGNVAVALESWQGCKCRDVTVDSYVPEARLLRCPRCSCLPAPGAVGQAADRLPAGPRSTKGARLFGGA